MTENPQNLRHLTSAPVAALLAIVGVEKADAVQCQQQGCNHRVYRRIHVVDEAGHLMVLGSSCFARRYGSSTFLGQPSIGGANGRQLTDEERQMLVDNTAALLARFRQDHLDSQEAAKAKLRALKAESQKQLEQRKTPNVWHKSIKRPPWPWVNPNSSVAYFDMKDGAGWVRVQDAQGMQMLMPWPTFEGWDEVFPASVGTPNNERGGYEVKDVVHAVSFLRARSSWVRIGIWSDVIP